MSTKRRVGGTTATFEDNALLSHGAREPHTVPTSKQERTWNARFVALPRTPTASAGLQPA